MHDRFVVVLLSKRVHFALGHHIEVVQLACQNEHDGKKL